nr:transposase [uncultured Streptococcus sp.]
MIDERIRIQENYDMTMETAIDEAREEGLERGIEKGLEQGLEQGLERGRYEERLGLVRKMLSRGLSLEVVSDVTGLSHEELEALLS